MLELIRFHVYQRRRLKLKHLKTLTMFFQQLRFILDSNLPGLIHYLTYGYKENRNPHPLFDEKYYKEENKDINNSNLSGLIHYLTYGYKENRNPHPLFDEKYYKEENKDINNSNLPGLIHYLTYGYKENRNPHPLINVKLLEN